MNGRPGGGGGAGTASQRSDRKIRLAHHDVHGFDRQAKLCGGDLGHDGVGAGADVVRGQFDIGRAVPLHPHPRIGGEDVRWIGRRGAAITDHPIAVGHRPDLPAPIGPAEALGHRVVALHQGARGERNAFGRVDPGVIGAAQLHRVHAQLPCQFVHRGLHAKKRSHLVGCTHEAAGVRVRPGEALLGMNIGAGIHRASNVSARIDDVVELRCLGGFDMLKGRQLAVGGGAEAEFLLGLGAEGGDGVHLRPRHDQADGCAEGLGRRNRQHRIGGYSRLGAECPAHEGRDHADARLRQPVCPGDTRAQGPYRLRRHPESQAIAAPFGGGRKHLHRVVMLKRRGESHVNRLRCGTYSGVHVAFGEDHPLTALARADDEAFGRIHVDRMGGRIVGYVHQSSPAPG